LIRAGRKLARVAEEGNEKPTRQRESVVQRGNLDADRPARVASSREGRGIERLARMLADGMLHVPVQAT
jgi:hypothetical protein